MYLPYVCKISSLASRHSMISVLLFIMFSSHACKSRMNCRRGCGSSVSCSIHCLVRCLWCCAGAVVGPIALISVCLHTLYAVTNNVFLPFLPRNTTFDQRPMPYGSVPTSIALDVQLSVSTVAVPPGWLTEMKLSLVKDEAQLECFHVRLNSLFQEAYAPFACQFVFVFGIWIGVMCIEGITKEF